MIKRISILFFLCMNLVSAQSYIITTYNDRDGVPSNSVFDILKDKKGRLWGCSDEGIFNFDGSSWNLELDSDIHKDLYYHRLLLDTKGNIWALPNISSLNIIYHDGKKWNQTKDFPTATTLKCFAKLVSEDTTLCVVTMENQILLYNDQRWRFIKLPAGSPANLEINTVIGTNNSFILGTSSGLIKLAGNDIHFMNELNNKLPTYEIFSLSAYNASSSSGSIWILGKTWFGQISPDNNLELIPAKINLPIVKGQHSYTFIKKAGAKRIYFGNEGVIYYFDRNIGKISELRYQRDLEYRGGTAIEYDAEQTLWISTLRGINKVRLIPFTNYDSKNGLPLDEVSALEILKDGSVLIGQYGILSLIKDQKINSFKLFDYGDPEGQLARVLDIKESRNGDIWLAVNRKGLGKLVGEKVRWIDNTVQLAPASIEEDNNGRIWIGTGRGLYSLENEKLIPYEKIEELGNIREIRFLSDGALGICTTNKGVSILRNGNIKNYLSSERAANSVYAIQEYNSKVLIGTLTGLYELAKDSLIKSSLLPNNNRPIYFIEKALKNDIWFGTNDGVICWDGKILRNYSKQSGLIGFEANRNAAAFDRNGNFWIGMDLGASYYIREYDEVIDIRPEGEIKYIELPSGKKYLPGEEIELDSDENNLWLHLRCFSLKDEKNNLFEVTLIKNNDEIIYSNTVNYTPFRLVSLSPGEYTFKVRAVNSTGFKSKEVYKTIIIIKNPFYLSVYFILPSLLALIIIGFFITTYFNQKKYSVKLEKEVSERTQLLQNEIEEKNKISEELTESEKRFRALFENSSFGIFQSTIEGKFLIANPAFVKMLGYNSFEEFSKIGLIKIYYDAKDRERLINLLFEKGFVHKMEVLLKKKDGSLMNVRINAQLRHDRGNKLIIEGSGEDITATKMFEKDLITAKEKAESSDRIKTEFLAQVSHEIRTPINTILSFSSLIHSEYKEILPAEFESVYHSIHNAGKRIIRTIDLILNMSEMQLGTYEPGNVKLNLIQNIIHPIYQDNLERAHQKNLDFIFSNSISNPYIYADEYTAVQIFENLIDNAIKFTQKGGVEIKISEFGNKLVVNIIDSGIGISTDYLPKLFEPFSQEEQGYTRKFEGNGLGLALVKKYCDLNGFEISVSSEKNKGSIFTVTMMNMI
ncbi:MAG: ATP-binding protein [bacterium]